MGDMVSNWLMAKIPNIMNWLGSLSERQMALFAVGAMILAYVLIVVVYNLYIGIVADVVDDEIEPYEVWMDLGRWNNG